MKNLILLLLVTFAVPDLDTIYWNQFFRGLGNIQVVPQVIVVPNLQNVNPWPAIPALK